MKISAYVEICCDRLCSIPQQCLAQHTDCYCLLYCWHLQELSSSVKGQIYVKMRIFSIGFVTKIPDVQLKILNNWRLQNATSGCKSYMNAIETCPIDSTPDADRLHQAMLLSYCIQNEWVLTKKIGKTISLSHTQSCCSFSVRRVLSSCRKYPNGHFNLEQRIWWMDKPKQK